MKTTNLLLWLLCLIMQTNGYPVDKLELQQAPPSTALDFMKRFGYLERDDGSSQALYTPEGIADAVRLVQQFGAIPETGVLDNATIQLMNAPRCGVPDVIRARRRRFAFGSKGWNKTTITYSVSNWSAALGERNVVKNVQLALDTWGRYGRLAFRRTRGADADIIVSFVTGHHGDAFPFDGRGNVLAHAFFPDGAPGLGGDIHFDADEPWADARGGTGEEGVDFFNVALHELGHSLGLAHSKIANAVMFPYYKEADPDAPVRLDYDDILGIYELYIKGRTFDPPPDAPAATERAWTTTPGGRAGPTVSYEGDDESVDDHKGHDPRGRPASAVPDACEGSFDSVATLRDELFIFKGGFIWRLKHKGRVEPGYPVPVHHMFAALPSHLTIDAAYERPDGMIVLFTGRQFWVYDGVRFAANSPRPLADYGLPHYLDRIDAAQIWGRNKKTYFYAGDRFWRYNETTKAMDEGYPRHMERWRGVPESINAATTWKGKTYFFKDELYWVFDNDWIIITEESPLPAPEIWLGCPENHKRLQLL